MPRNDQCVGCHLHATVNNVCLWGEQRNGPFVGDTRVMVIGEAPGANEDALGHPFIGASGRELEDAFERMGFNHPYYITNVVKCRSVGPPGTKEIKACKEYLLEEIAHVRPTHILLLGGTAWKQFGKGSVTEASGKEVWSPSLEAWVLPAHHPAFLLRSPERKPAWLADLARFARLVDGSLVERPPVQVQLMDNQWGLDRLLDTLRDSEGFAYDFEANLFPWWHTSFRPLSISFSGVGGDTALVVPLLHPESPLSREEIRRFFGQLAPIMQDSAKSKGPHNLLYDDLVFYRMTGVLPYTTFDTMVAAHLLDENRPKSLKWLGRAILGWPQWDIDIVAAHRKIDAAQKRGASEIEAYREHLPLNAMAGYNGFDSAAAWLLRGHFLEQFDQDPGLLRYFRYVDMPKVRNSARIMARGIYVNMATLGNHWIQSQGSLERVDELIPVENPGSSTQIAKWLFVDNKLPAIKDGKLHPSTDESVINRLAAKFPAARLVKDRRRHAKNINTYFFPVSEALNHSFDGRAHPDYRSTAVETGRLSSSFHTTPRDPWVRSIYDAPPGWVLVQADYAQIEARIAAWKASGCPESLDQVPREQARMLYAFLEGRDVYIEQAMVLLGKRREELNLDKSDPQNDRQVMGKVPVLASLYRISPRGLQRYAWDEFELDWSMATATRVWNAFYSAWPEFQRWHRLEDRILRARGYSRSPLGRIRRLPAATSSNEELVHAAVNAGINAPVQSVASDILQTALQLVENARGHSAELRAGLLPVGSVHDALLFQVQQQLYDNPNFLPELRGVMEDASTALKPLGLHLPTGLIGVEISAGPWGLGKVAT